jgi:glycosyltransferase involved in cell wall biosynthesis
MNVLFFDPTQWVYDADTPFQRPLGGTQSAVSYLTPELAKLGINVTVLNGIQEPSLSRGVQFRPLPCLTEELNSFDVIVVVSSPRAGLSVRSVGCDRPMVLWCHHAVDQPAIQLIGEPSVQQNFSAYAMVSQWQAEQYKEAFNLPAEQIAITRNAVSVPFLNTRPKKNWVDHGRPPVLAYTSTPYRGLDVMLLSLPTIRAALGDVRLRVYSSMGISQASQDENIIAALFDVCRVMPGVEYIGPKSQQDLANDMEEVDIWSYPCTFPETSCISAMEAMAAGCLLVTSNMGALPETVAGMAHTMELSPTNLYRPGVLASQYARYLIDAVREHESNRPALSRYLDNQMAAIKSHYSWANRARDWVPLLERLASGQPRSALI